MAQKKISELPIIETPSSSAIIPIVVDSTNSYTTANTNAISASALAFYVGQQISAAKTNATNTFVNTQNFNGAVFLNGDVNIGGNVIGGIRNEINGLEGYTASLKGQTIVSSSQQITDFGFISSSQTINIGSLVTTSSFNLYTGSIREEVNGLEEYTASLKGQTILSSSQQIQNYNLFAQTSSANIFYGNQTISGSLAISGSITNVNSISFNQTAGVSVVAGEMGWNNSDGTLDIGLKGGNVKLQVGQETLYEVRNDTGVSIPVGTSLFANGVTVGSGRITAAPFVADGDIREVRYLGLATETIGTGVNGFVTHFGYVRGLDTRGTTASSIAVGDESWEVGDILYAHPTVPGKLTNILPKHEIIVAIVIVRHQSTGVLFVRPSSFGHLEDNHDVNINTASLSTGDLLVYDGVDGNWRNTTSLSGSYQITGSLNVTGSINIDNVIKLTPQHPLPSGEAGILIASASYGFTNLYMYDGSEWKWLVTGSIQ